MRIAEYRAMDEQQRRNALKAAEERASAAGRECTRLYLVDAAETVREHFPTADTFVVEADAMERWILLRTVADRDAVVLWDYDPDLTGTSGAMNGAADDVREAIDWGLQGVDHETEYGVKVYTISIDATLNPL